MAAPLIPTKAPGIYKRGSRYVVRYRANGRQHQESAATMKQARAIKSAREADRHRGEFQEESRIPFRRYAEEWIESYIGNGRRGFTDETRADYRRDLNRYAFPFFDDRLGRTVSSITPRDVDRWITWICDEREQGRRRAEEQRERTAQKRNVPVTAVPAVEAKPLRLSDATVRRIVSPVRACLATARREGLIRHNPADGAVLPHREEVKSIADGEDEGHVRVFTRDQLDAVLRVAHPRRRVMFRLLAQTGLRWGEVAALRRGDLVLDGSRPVVRVRRTVTKGGRFKPPKSRHGIREVPLSPALVSELRKHLAALPPSDPDSLAFPSRRGTPLLYRNVLERDLRPAVEEAGAAWAAFHTFRHTFASLHIARGTNIVQLSRLLGHHSPDFTLRVYAHLIPGDEAEALDLGAELAGVESSDGVSEPALAQAA